MYTQCSNCDTVFRVTAEHLRPAQGLVRCCTCHAVFDGLIGLVDSLPAAAAIAPVAAAEAAGETDLFIALPALASRAAVPAQPVPSRSGLVRVVATGLLLSALLVLPYAYLMREELGRYPQLRPWMDALCGVAGCELPLLRDVARIHILYKDVAGPATSSANLHLRATIVNDTGFRQPYPQIRFRFMDPVGAAQASRWFAPDDYLTEQQKSELAAGMPPQEPVAVRLQLAGMDLAAMDNFIIDLR